MPYSPSDTRASLILRLCDAEDTAAWTEFTEIYVPVVLRLAQRHGLQLADAEDLVQEVLSAVARSVATWTANERRGKFRAWLYRIARNHAIDFLTRRKHRAWAAGGESAGYVLGSLEQQEEVTSEFNLEYRREVFRWASAQVQGTVSERTWRAFWMTSVLDQSVNEVGEQLQMSAGSVYIARSRVMKRLRALVKQYGELKDAM